MDFAQARTNMVDTQLRTNRIDNPSVLAALGDVPREVFLPKALHGVAYTDEDLPLQDGRFLIEPLAFARLLQAAEIEKDDVSLVIGCDTGYVATVVSRLAATVINMQRDDETAARIQPVLDNVEADNVVSSISADVTAGDPGQAPYDVIMVIGSVPEIPEALIDQLGEGGRLVAVVGQGRVGKGVMITKIHGTPAQRLLFDAHIPELSGFEKKTEFAF
jgi:protein-L-isoaspartate(D-aspartate) O-methyltransferase